LNIYESDPEHTYNTNRRVKKRKVKRKIRWIKFIIMVLLFISALVLIGMTPLFNITSIEIKNNQHYKRDDIIGIADVNLNTNGFARVGHNIVDILTLRYGNAEQKILESCPYIKSVTVKYSIPNKVKIYTIERKPLAIIPYHGAGILIDNDGYVLETITEPKKYKIPLLKGFKFGDYKVGQVLQISNTEVYNSVYRLISALNEVDSGADFKIFPLIKFIDAGDPDKVYLGIDSRIVVSLGNLNDLVSDSQDLTYKVKLLKQIFRTNIKPQDKGFLDFTIGKDPVFRHDSNIVQN
jgi:cell division protein FtsQ